MGWSAQALDGMGARVRTWTFGVTRRPAPRVRVAGRFGGEARRRCDGCCMSNIGRRNARSAGIRNTPRHAGARTIIPPPSGSARPESIEFVIWRDAHGSISVQEGQPALVSPANSEESGNRECPRFPVILALRVRRDHDPRHCPAFGTGELRRNGAFLAAFGTHRTRRRRSRLRLFWPECGVTIRASDPQAAAARTNDL